jgi:ABC-type lipoprotein export system ATPase subunit
MSAVTLESGLSLHCQDLRHVYQLEETEVVALAGVTLTVRAGETVALLGPSGCGKSTLLSVVAGLQRPTAGRVLLGRDEVTAMNVTELLSLRSNRIGIVVQSPGRTLLPYATPEGNMHFAQRGTSPSRRAQLPAVGDLLSVLGLQHLAGRRVHAMSGGEQQWVAVAVALACGPGLLLADEPTSQLDDANRDALVGLLIRANTSFGTTILTVTHDETVALAHRRLVRLHEGRVDSDAHLDEDVVRMEADGTIRMPEHARRALGIGAPLRIIATVDGIRLVRDEGSAP